MHRSRSILGRRLKRLSSPRAFLAVLPFLPAAALTSASPPPKAGEYEVKAACIYKLSKYVTWPPHCGLPNAAVPEFRIGVVGRDPFGPAWRIIKGKTIAGKTVAIKRFAKIPQSEKSRKELLRCKALFVSLSSDKELEDLFALIKGKGILTFGESESFLSKGGIFRFVLIERKVRFEVNLVSAQQEGFSIKAAVLRLAHKVVRKPADHKENRRSGS